MKARLRFALSATVLALSASPAIGASNWGDRPLQIIQSFDVQFPAALLMQGITEGEVRVVLNVDADGQLADCLVVAYTRPELVTELLSAMRDWRYQPSYSHGEPTGARAEVAFSFQARGTTAHRTKPLPWRRSGR
jgi:outer membrane biosynthesis protein TonB